MYSTTGQADKLPSLTSTPCFRFSLAGIQSATKDFDDELVIGHGGFGKVYKGCISIKDTGHVVAIKRLDSMSDQGASEFRAEIKMLSKLRHCHLVSLIGYCDDNKEMILVYAYMPNGTLYHHLHKAKIPLNWMQRLKIAIGASRGLDYLHTGVGTQHGVIHRDVKSSNILLDENWAAKISDFGLSKIGPTNQSSSYIDVTVKGTFGYLDPEYFYTRKLTRKTDVYAFGVVLFELLSGRLAVDERNSEEQCSLVRWAQKCVKERKIDQMVDSNIRGTVLPKCLRRFAQIADRCLHSILKERPAMSEVVVSLQALLELQQRHDNKPSRITGFTWKIHKYLGSSTKQSSDESSKSLSSMPENNTSQCSSSNMDGSYQGEMPRQQGELVVTDLIPFTYDELRYAAKGFRKGTCLSDKSYAKVYEGWMDDSWINNSRYKAMNELPVVIKECKLYRLVHRLDLEKLIVFSHPNVVKLIGYCLQDKRVFLVHEFMHNGNFEDLMYSGGVARLSLVTKVKLAVGIARGIVFLQKTQDQNGTLSESRLDRHNIMLDKNFTAKLSDYDVTKLVHGRYRQSIRPREFEDYPLSVELSQLQTNLSGFTVIFAEVLTGKHILDDNEFQKIDNLFIQQGIVSLVDIAKSCFDICNEVDSESKMLRILQEYEQYIPACQNEAFRSYLWARSRRPSIYYRDSYGSAK